MVLAIPMLLDLSLSLSLFLSDASLSCILVLKKIISISMAQPSSLTAILRRCCLHQSAFVAKTTSLSQYYSQTQTSASSVVVDALKYSNSNSSIVREVYDAVVMWMAVPKRKVTPSRKGNRSATKFTRRVPVVSQCSRCSRVFPPHAMPSSCPEDECPAFPHGQGRRKEEEEAIVSQ